MRNRSAQNPVAHLPLLLVLVLFLLLLPAWALWPSLSGPFLFDDIPNLDALALLQGDVTLTRMADYLSSKSAGPTGRPLAMLSFLLNDNAWPSDPYSFKYTNLCIHLLNGLLLAWLTIRVIHAHFQHPAANTFMLGLLVSAFWVLNPYHLSSVAYVVQRMALLSTTCVLGGLILLIAGREALARHQNAKGYGLIWGSYILGAGIGMLFKENAALYALLAPVFSHFVFSGPHNRMRSPLLLRLTLIIPALVVATALIQPLFDTYSYQWFRDFSLGERLLSQTRALGYYLWRYLIPGISYAGVYTDAFPKSTGLLSPPSTIIWLLAHIGLISAALILRKRWPLLALGVSAFYIAHSMESGAVALELFFEHRNYLPSAFLLLGALHCAPSRNDLLAISAVLLVTTGLQHLQSRYWGNEKHLYAIMAIENPTSERANITYANYLERQGEQMNALSLMRQFSDQHPAGMDISLNTVMLACFMGQDSPEDVRMLLASPATYRGKAAVMVDQVRNIAQSIKNRQCQTTRLSDLEQFLDNYMTAYPRDTEATQAQLVARAYVAYYSGHDTGFTEHLVAAVNTHPNPSLAFSTCQQITVSKGTEAGCDCLKQRGELIQNGNRHPNLTQRLLGRQNSLAQAYQDALKQTCSHVEATSG